MPWSPPIRFCSMVGHASIHTAWASGPSTMERSSGLAAALGIEAPGPGPRGGEVEPGEAEQDGGGSLVEHRPETVGRVAPEISDGHPASQKISHRPRGQY